MMLNGRLTHQQVRDLLGNIKERCDLASKDTLLKSHIQRIDTLLNQLRS